jgi:hypothetical protein
MAAHAAATAAGTPAATAAARACGHGIAVAQMAGHARGAVRYALKVVDLSNGDSAAAAVALEDEWQRSHVPARFLGFVDPESVSPEPTA